MDQYQEQQGDEPVYYGADTPITLADAQAKLQRFRDRILGLPDYPRDVNQTVACHVTRTDLQHLLDNYLIDGIRCYLGLRYDDQLKQDAICLVMVGTVWNKELNIYQDVILDGVGGDFGIYDLTMPCPNTCDDTSKLMTLIP